jgi:hypothetical protein
MVEEYLKYIDKQDCERRGLVRTADGKYYKNCTLERYEAKGYLDGEKYDSQQLLGAGLRLAKDFYLSRLATVSANDVSKVRVDGCGNSNTSDSILFALDRFHDACRAVPYEFWGVISKVCCDDIDIIGEINERSKRQKQYRIQVLLALLRMGLVRLVEHYR